MNFINISDVVLKSYLGNFSFYSNPEFYGTEKYHRINAFFNNFLVTDGVFDAFNKKKCFWVGDTVASYINSLKTVHSGTFFTVNITINEDSSCDFIIHDGNYNLIIHQPIPFTDLEINLEFFLVYDQVNWIMMLPSEY